MYVTPMRNSPIGRDRLTKQALCRYELCPQAFGEMKFVNPPPSYQEMLKIVEREKTDLANEKEAILLQKKFIAEEKKKAKIEDQIISDEKKEKKVRGGKRKRQDETDSDVDDNLDSEITDNDTETPTLPTQIKLSRKKLQVVYSNVFN